jgi:hypothetical protein
MLLDELRRLEEGFWHATTDPGYYRRHMRDDGLAVFAGSVMTKDEAEASTTSDASSGWQDVRITDARVLEVADGVAALIYDGTATRAGQRYRATCTSVYTRDAGEWRMVLHQQSQVHED